MMLTARLRKEFPGFDLDVDLHFQAGVTALFGPSGSGKTSIIRALAGLLRCEVAQIALDGRDLGSLPVHKRNMGCVFQAARLFPHLNVRDNLRFAGTTGEADVIDLLGLSALLDRHPSTLSGGEAQRVALGRALMSGPDVLLLDEPLSALDGPRKAEVLPYLERLRDTAHIPIIYVSHDMSEVARLAQELVVLDQGKVVLSGDLVDVLADPLAVPFIGVQDAGAVLTGRVVGHADDGLTKVETEAGALWVPGIGGRAGGAVRIRIPAQDIILARERPAGLSALNVLDVEIATMSPGKGPGVAVGLKAGQARLLARVTKRSAEALGLATGQRVCAILKATAIAPGDIAQR